MQEFVKEYLSLLKIEKNLSDNSINSYKNDLLKFINFLDELKISDLNKVSVKHITDFFAKQRKN